MKLALLQLNYVIGDLEHNAKKIIENVKKLDGKADLCISSELALIGYPPKDLLLRRDFVQKVLVKIDEIADSLRDDCALLLGCILPNVSAKGKPLYNAAVLLEKGQITQRFYKALLPTYDVFDEDRYFESGEMGQILEFRGKKWGITICEDMWNDTTQWGVPRYHTNALECFSNQKIEGIINLSASPYSMGKHAQQRLSLMQAWTERYKVPFFYVNQVGGNDDLVFDGNSVCVNAQGECVAHAQTFAEDVLILDLADISAAKTNTQSMAIEEEIFQALVCGVRDYVQKCGFQKVLLGLSGGMDSALVMVIAVHALGAENVTGVLMPSKYSSAGSIEDAMQLARNMQVHTLQFPIHNIVATYEDSFQTVFEQQEPDSTEENIQARIRGNILMALSNKWRALLLTTGNKSELSVGYCTIYGDMCGGLAVIADVYKTMVYRIAEWYNRTAGTAVIPVAILQKAPSAELRPDQTDQDSLPPYEILDDILYQMIECRSSIEEIIALGFAKETVQHIVTLVNNAEFKRYQAAPGLKISACAYGTGRRMPIAAKYQYKHHVSLQSSLNQEYTS